jgi:hypothetical protein
MRDALLEVLAGLGLQGLELVLDEAEATARDAAPGVTVHLPEALRLALEAFTSALPEPGLSGVETPSAVVRAEPEAFGLAADASPAEVSSVLLSWLTDDPAARVVLLTPATLAMEPYRFPPEDGEDPERYWVFRVVTPRAYPGLWWAIVDEAGEPGPYAYGYA